MVARTQVAQVRMNAVTTQRMPWRFTVALPRRALLAAVLLSLALAAALALEQRRPGVSAPSTSHRASAPTQPRLSGLELAVQAAASAAIGARSRGYAFTRSAGALLAANPAQRLRASFRAGGVRFDSGKSELALSLHAVGYGGSLAAVQHVSPRIAGDRMLYVRSGLTEWYANGPLGFEQGFTLAHAPAAGGAGPLTFAMTLSGNLDASLDAGGQGIALGRPGGPSLRYGGLVSTDASGRTLRTWLELRSGMLLLRVDTTGARYPLRVDPFVQQGGELQGGGESGEGQFGFSVSLAGNGDTALIGAPADNGEVGAAWVFTRSGTTWTQQGGKMTGSGESGAGAFGHSVALSVNGKTALIGAPNDNAKTGAAWVFTRSGTTWTQLGSKLKGSGETGKGQFGFGVALAGDGETALIGGPVDHGGIGAAWPFALSGSAWSQQGSKLTGSGDIDVGAFGTSTALSSDGDTALVGAPASEKCEGGAWTFIRSGTTWSQQGNLIGPGRECPTPDSDDDFGASVALSSNGDTALVGLPPAGPLNNRGAAVFTRTGTSWGEQTQMFGYGSAVALSSTGDLALLAGWAPAEPAFPGTANVFTRAGSTWSELDEELTSSSEIAFGEYGQGAALSSNGETALIGGPDESAGGGAWVFGNVGPRVTEVKPQNGPPAGGTSVTITGANLKGATKIKFGRTVAESFTVKSATTIVAVSPPGSGSVDVTVTTPQGTSPITPADMFAYEAAPTVTKVAPVMGPAGGGTTVTITGANITDATAVHFGANSATSFEAKSANSLAAVSPPGSPGTVDVTVETPEGTSATSSHDHFKYTG